MKRGTALAPIAALTLFSGCYHTQVRNDGNQVRKALLEMYTDQAMDNLIRARNNLPFIQLNYHDLLVQATDQYTGTFTNTQTFAADRSLTFIKLAASAMRTVGTNFSFGGTAQRQDLLSFKADPITDQDDIYDKYLAFARDPARFQVSDHAPRFPVHLMRKFQGCYYYIPCEYAQDFLELILQTTIQRGFNAAPCAYQVTILSAMLDPTVPLTGVGDDINAIIFFNTQVPNGSGRLIITLTDGRKVDLKVDYVPIGPDGRALPRGKPTDRLQAQWNRQQKGFDVNNLRNARGQLYSDDYPPALSTIDPTAKRISANVDLIRANTSINTLKPP